MACTRSQKKEKKRAKCDHPAKKELLPHHNPKKTQNAKANLSIQKDLFTFSEKALPTAKRK